MRAPSLWDLVGAACLATFGGSLYLLHHQRAARETAEAAALTPGSEIRAGDEWLGLYFKEEKIGLTRITKSPREGGEWDYRVQSTLKLAAMGVSTQAELDLRALLGPDRALRTFELALTTGGQQFRGEGRVEGTKVQLTLNTGGERIERTLDLPQPPVLRDLLGPALAARELKPGARFELPGFDPWTLSAAPVEIEVVGPDTVIVMAQELPATRIRQRLEGLTLDAWLNERGEMLRQELPLGLVAVRQSEEEARWGLAAETGTTLLQSVEIPVEPLPRPPAKLSKLVLQVGGAAESLDRPPGQVQRGDTLTLTRAPLEAGLPLPVSGRDDPELLAAMRADAVVQADHPKIRAAARERSQNATNTLSAAQSLVTWLHGAMTFERRGGVPSALETLETMTGDCTETAALFAALARAAGVPTRIVFGLVYKAEPAPRFAWHAWNEVRTATGWLPVDPTWGQVPADVGHVALAAGGLERQADLLRWMGHLKLAIRGSE